MAPSDEQSDAESYMSTFMYLMQHLNGRLLESNARDLLSTAFRHCRNAELLSQLIHFMQQQRTIEVDMNHYLRDVMNYGNVAALGIYLKTCGEADVSFGSDILMQAVFYLQFGVLRYLFHQPQINGIRLARVLHHTLNLNECRRNIHWLLVEKELSWPELLAYNYAERRYDEIIGRWFAKFVSNSESFSAPILNVVQINVSEAKLEELLAESFQEWQDRIMHIQLRYLDWYFHPDLGPARKQSQAHFESLCMNK
jgi:hypothetical protein